MSSVTPEGAPGAPDTVRLDDLEPVHVAVGYGELGRRGSLGYEDKRVCVAGTLYLSALSTHPTSSVRYPIPSGASRFDCMVAINDDSAGHDTYADFTVLCGGLVVAEVADVRSGAAPVPLSVDLDGATELELVTHTTAWAHCHAVWLEPTLGSANGSATAPPTKAVIADPLRRANLRVPQGIPRVARAVVTVASAGFEQWLDDLLGSVRAFGGCRDALLAVLLLGDAPEAAAVAERWGAVVVPCEPLRPLDPTSKAVLYSVGRLLPAERIVCLDADMLVLADLEPLFATIDALPPESMLACSEGNEHGLADLGVALDLAYGGGPDPPFFSRSGPHAHYPLVINDGLLAGSRAGFLALERQVGSLPGVLDWVDARPDIRWRNQFAVNVALAAHGWVTELDPRWNVQLHAQDVEIEGGTARWRGADVRVLHFSGHGKQRLGSFRESVRAATGIAALADTGRLEEALSAYRQLSGSNAVHPALESRMVSLEIAMALPTPGERDLAHRQWSSSLPRAVLEGIQNQVHHQRYRGRQFVKSPFDIAMYLQLLERERPRTIIEVGSKEGGSALWLADTARALGLECGVLSFDVVPPEPAEHDTVEFRRGDGRRFGEALVAAAAGDLPHPWLVIEDADHAEATTLGVLRGVHPFLEPGDLAVVEDGNLSDLYPESFPEFSSGPHAGLRSFLADHGADYEIAADLCDLYGYNTATATNGILRRAPPTLPTPIATKATVPEQPPLRSRPWLEAVVPSQALAVPTMLSLRERQVLYWLARHHVTGEGRIVDGGCFLGGSTAALASGLAARDDGVGDSMIASYDRFLVEEYTLAGYGPDLSDPTVGASFRPDFERNVAPWARYVDVHAGDAVAVAWSGEPIEVLFLDMVKTWELNDLVLGEFLGCLVPGHSVIIQQDYLWGYGHWIHLTMEVLDDCVERIDAMPNGSVVYLLTDPVPDHVIGARLREQLPADEQRRLMRRAVERWSGDDRGLVELAQAMMTAELDGHTAARAELDDLVQRYAGSARVLDCARVVAQYLAPG